MPRPFRAVLLFALLLAMLPGGAARSYAAEHDTVLITPEMQGHLALPNTGLALEFGYGAVSSPTQVTVTNADGAFDVTATTTQGARVQRFELPLLLLIPGEGDTRTAILGWPQSVSLTDEPDSVRWIVAFDAHGLYAQPEGSTSPDAVLYLGPLEHYTPNLIEHDPALDALPYTALPSGASSSHYRDRFLPEVRSNPGAYRVLGWTGADDLPDLIRALRATIPDDPDLPVPGTADAPLPLILPFDCGADWVVSWGYHGSSPQNRFAVDFAAELAQGTAGQPVYAAHAGTVYLKRYGEDEPLIDLGFAARIVAADGVTSTVYGHLDPASTLARWSLDMDDLPSFEWVEAGTAAQGERIGVAGRAGYATGAHIHFALWMWDQSLYQPVPLGPLGDFPRGLRIPAAARRACDIYAP
ncbi:MAG TPA: M23 family metallopeptidase [Aggregatilinea sp.]|uniref:M23 family metallopeptidase n=1 Tax=Aggregatilinea sp. TaxID=2806333 RepID=UPI002B8A73CE|nr:M23 family metallopeptidase [Aggregatilinea sp.]HML23716.1 M23 family metallopeptidase [Aggregatilinea sp.]